MAFLFDLLPIDALWCLICAWNKKMYLWHFFFNLVRSSSLHIFSRYFDWLSTLLKEKKNVHKDMRKNSSAGHGTGQLALGGPRRILDQVTSRAAFPPQPFCESVGACVWGLNFIIAPQISHGLTWGEDLGKGWKWPSSHQAYPRLTPSAVVGQILSSW